MPYFGAAAAMRAISAASTAGATLGLGKTTVRDAIYSVGAHNESRVLSLMSALPAKFSFAG
jgi:hypothetical protein